MSSPERRNITIKKGKLGQDDDKFLDYEYWDKLGDEAKFTAAWELVVQAYEIAGLDPNELRFQRSVEKLSKFPGAEAYQRKEMVKIGDLEIPFISRQDLIMAKLAAGRPQDLVDAGALAKKGKKS